MVLSEGSDVRDQFNILSPEITELFTNLQDACTQIKGGASRLGLLDLVTVGQESHGKSSLLTALSSLKLPTGTDVTTKNPVRINLKNSGSGIRIEMPSGEWRQLRSEGLDKNTYEEALAALQEKHPQCQTQTGGVVRDELVIEVSKEGQPPLSILDLPGLIFNQSLPRRAPIEELVGSFLEPNKEDGSYMLPILVCKADGGIAGMQTGLVEGRDFVTVLTFLGSLGKVTGGNWAVKKENVLAVLRTKKELEAKGCRGLFLVQAPDGEEAPADYKSIVEGLSKEDRLEIRSMCGIAALKKGLQELQFNHMMSHYDDVMDKLRSRLKEISPSLKMINLPQEKLQQEFCTKLQQIQRDVEYSFGGLKILLDSVPSDIPEDHQLHNLADDILNEFSMKAHQHVLEDVKANWAKESSRTLSNNTRLNDWQKEAWNMAAKATSNIFGEDFLGDAKKSLKEKLRNFLEWRFKHRMFGWDAARAGFYRFLDKYLEDKDELLNHEAAVLQDEVKSLKLMTYAPFAYWLFLDDQEMSMTLAKKFLSQSHLIKDVKLGQLVAKEFGPLQNDQYRDTFVKEWSDTQTKTMVLTFFKAGLAVDRITARMINVMFYRTFIVLDNTVTLYDSSLASKTLQQAFELYCEQHKETTGNNLDLREWLKKGAESMVLEQKALQRAIAGLDKFRDRASQASNLQDTTRQRQTAQAKAEASKRAEAAGAEAQTSDAEGAGARPSKIEPFPNGTQQLDSGARPRVQTQTAKIPGQPSIAQNGNGHGFSSQAMPPAPGNDSEDDFED